MPSKHIFEVVRSTIPRWQPAKQVDELHTQASWYWHHWIIASTCVPVAVVSKPLTWSFEQQVGTGLLVAG